MRKSKTRKEALRKADTWFSIYVRLRDADSQGEVSCITCDKKLPWDKAHAGHFMRRWKLATRFEEQNVHAQCPTCNTFREGEQYKHAQAIDLLHGAGTAENLAQISEQITKYSKEDLDEIAMAREQEAREIARVKGITITR